MEGKEILPKRVINKWELIFLLSSLGILLLVSYNSFLYPVQIENDSNVFITAARYMSEGKFPYKDFFDHKGPMLYILYFLAYSLIPGTCHGIYLMEVICAYLYMHFTYKSVQLIAATSKTNNECANLKCALVTIIGCAGSYCITGQSQIEALSLPMTAYFLYVLIKWIKTEEMPRRSIYFIGIHCGMIFWMKYYVLLFASVLIISYCVICVYKKKYKDIKNMFAYGFLGFMTTTFIVLIYLLLTDSLFEMIYVYFYKNLFQYASNLNNDNSAIYIKIGSSTFTCPGFLYRLSVFTYSIPIVYMILVMLLRGDLKHNDRKNNAIFIICALDYVFCNLITAFTVLGWKYYYINFTAIYGIIFILCVTPPIPEKMGKHHKLFAPAFIGAMGILIGMLLVDKMDISDYNYNRKVQEDIVSIIKSDVKDMDDLKLCIYNSDYGYSFSLGYLSDDYYFVAMGPDYHKIIKSYGRKIEAKEYDYILSAETVLSNNLDARFLRIVDETEDEHLTKKEMTDSGYEIVYDNELKQVNLESCNHIILYRKRK